MMIDITTDDLRDTRIECNSESSMIFSTLLVFSTESGDETASTLANRLSQQVSSGLAVDINRGEAKITSACSNDCYQSIDDFWITILCNYCSKITF